MTLREEGEAPAPDASDELADPEVATSIRCAACGAPITEERHRTEAHGAHEHRRVNPSGVDFHLACFALAPGATAAGTPTLFWTWFPGYAWRYAHCAACGAHLGWRFDGEGTFWGLIVSQLIAGPEP